MIEYGLVFALGALVAGLVWLILLPAFWRRAVRITTERLVRRLPISENEIRAEHDRLRAEHAVAIARIERTLALARGEVALARGETGTRLSMEAGFLETIEAGKRRIAALETDIAGLNAEIAARELTIANLRGEREEAGETIAELERRNQALEEKAAAVASLADERRVALDEARVLGDRAREALVEETHRAAQLRAELQSRTAELRDLERRMESIDHAAILTRIRGGEETYQSEFRHENARRTG